MYVDDRELLALIEREPSQGLEVLHALYAKPLWLTALRLAGDAEAAHECAQDTLTDFYMRRERFDPARGSLHAYLTAIAERKAMAHYRQSRRRALAEELSCAEPTTSDDWEQHAALHQAMSQLSEADRTLLTLRYFHGYTIREIAAAHALEYETAKKRQQRALKKLLRLLQEEDEG